MARDGVKRNVVELTEYQRGYQDGLEVIDRATG